MLMNKCGWFEQCSHLYFGPSTVPSRWFFLSLWGGEGRGGKRVSRGQRLIYIFHCNQQNTMISMCFKSPSRIATPKTGCGWGGVGWGWNDCPIGKAEQWNSVINIRETSVSETPRQVTVTSASGVVTSAALRRDKSLSKHLLLKEPCRHRPPSCRLRLTALGPNPVFETPAVCGGILLFHS